tara:strand:+ start:97 stop:684 length:588 start_codon:yes stop_codon:yes gene_type:complete
MTATLTRTQMTLIASLGALLIAVTLYAWGQPPICTCGEVRLWAGSIFASGNSQHIADWYTLSHILTGVLIIVIGRLFFARVAFSFLFAIAIVIGVAWEIIEHTEWVLGLFRATTINQGYVGDSVLNAVADYVWMLAGFFTAHALRTTWALAMIALFEISAALIARDSLTLTTLMLIYPVEAVETWQQAINPNAPG